MGVSLCPPSCRRDVRPLKRGAPLPLCPSDHHHCPLLAASLAPCCWRSCRPCSSHAAMQPIVGAARGANVRHPMCNCQGPAGPGFVRFLLLVCGGCVSSDTVVHCPLSTGSSTQPLLFIVVVIVAGTHKVSSPRVLLGRQPTGPRPTPFDCTVAKVTVTVTSAAVEY